MTTFVLKKYEPAADTIPSEEAPAKATEEKKEEMTIEVSASDSVAKIVAAALYKALPVNVVVTEKEDTGDTTNAISTEDINKDPATLINKIKAGDNLLIIGKGFSTAKEEWFLSTADVKKINLFYSVESFIRHVKQLLNLQAD